MKTKSIILLAALTLIILIFAQQPPALTAVDSADSALNTALGEPGATFTLVDQYGIDQTAYIEDFKHFNVPSSVFVDSSDNLWIGEGNGTRAIKIQ